MDFMKSNPLQAVMSRKEEKIDAIGRVARDIIAQEAALRVRNTERLRKARLAHAADNPPLAPVIKIAPKRRKATTNRG